MSFTGAPPAVVVDASVAVDFLQMEPRWVNQWVTWSRSETMLLAPMHFFAEVANALLRSRQLPEDQVGAQIERLGRSGVDAADRGMSGLLQAVVIAGRHRLTVYDALYLQLAMDLEGELATLDKALQRAATAEGITLAG